MSEEEKKAAVNEAEHSPKGGAKGSPKGITKSSPQGSESRDVRDGDDSDIAPDEADEEHDDGELNEELMFGTSRSFPSNFGSFPVISVQVGSLLAFIPDFPVRNLDTGEECSLAEMMEKMNAGVDRF
jgi:hypothetical protein